jgi:hypothetical protein
MAMMLSRVSPVRPWIGASAGVAVGLFAAVHALGGFGRSPSLRIQVGPDAAVALLVLAAGGTGCLGIGLQWFWAAARSLGRAGVWMYAVILLQTAVLCAVHWTLMSYLGSEAARSAPMEVLYRYSTYQGIIHQIAFPVLVALTGSALGLVCGGVVRWLADRVTGGNYVIVFLGALVGMMIGVILGPLLEVVTLDPATIAQWRGQVQGLLPMPFLVLANLGPSILGCGAGALAGAAVAGWAYRVTPRTGVTSAR